MFGYIYKTTYLIDGRVYIGKRQKSYFDKYYYGSGKHLINAIKKYGKNNFSVEILEWCENKEQLNSREKYWISEYNSRDCKIGFNIAKGGEGGIGHKTGEFHHSEDTKKLISSKNKGKSSPIKNKIAIYDKSNDTVIYIKLEEWPLYKNYGWVRFNPKAKQSNYTYMIDLEGNNKQVDNYEVDHYLSLGYTLGRNWKPCEGIKQSKDWVDSRVSKTKLKLTNKRHINNGYENKYIDKDELDYYLSLGWVEGEIKNKENLGKHSANRVWINNSNICKFILNEELDDYLNDGWVKGRLKNN